MIAKQIKISVIMAVYDDIKYLSKAIESILNQTYTDFEFIIIYDCGNSNSLELIQGYSKKDERIIIIENKKNIGLPASLNKGIDSATGKYIARMDADDIASIDRLKIQIDFMERNNDIFLCGGNAKTIDSNGNTTGNLAKKSGYIVKPYNSSPLIHPTFFFKNDGSRYREKFQYAQDYDFILNALLASKKVYNLNQDFLNYRVHKKSISVGKNNMQNFYKRIAKISYILRKYFSIDIYSLNWDYFVKYYKNNPKNMILYINGKNISSYDIYKANKISKKLLSKNLFSTDYWILFLSTYSKTSNLIYLRMKNIFK